MNNIAGVFCKKKCILPTKNELITIYLFDRTYYIRYLQQMRHNKNRVIVYSSCDKISDMNLNHNQRHHADEKNIVLKNFPMVTKFLSLYILFKSKLKKEVYFFINYLCVVHGLQIASFNQDTTKWHIYTCVKIYSKYKILFIQLTDCCFILQLVIKDITNILIIPILGIIDIITLSKVKHYLSQNCLSFVKWISFLSQTFLFQIDEDGQQILTTIKETDVFRRQKPGTVSFFKKNFNYNEDFTFFAFRYLQKKTYLFFRLITLSTLFLIFFKTNQQLKSEPSLPKLAYIISNFNLHDQEIMHESSWKRIFNQIFLVQHSSQFTDSFKLLQTSKVVKSRFSDKVRIVNLLHAGKLKKKMKLNVDNNQFKDQSLSDQLDLYFFDQKNMSYNNQILKNSKILYKEDFLIKLRKYDYNKLENIYIKYIPNITNTDFGQYKNLFVNKIHKLKDKYLNFEERILINKFSYIKKKNFFQKANSLSHVLEKFLKIDFILKKIKSIFNEKTIKIYKIENKNIFSNNYIKEYLIKNPILNKTIFLDDDLYKNRLLLLTKHYLNDLIHISRNVTSHWFNICLRFAEIHFQCVNYKYKYITSLVDVNEKVFLSEKYPYNLKKYNIFSNKQGFIGSCDKNQFQDLSKFQTFLYFHKQKKIVNEFEIYFRKNSSFITELNALDTLHFGSETCSNSNVIDHIDQTLINIILLFYVEFFDKIDIFNQSIHDQIIILSKNGLENVQQKVCQFISDEKFRLNLLCNKIRKHNNYDINTFHLSNETNKTDIVISHPQLQLNLIKFMSIKNTKLLKNNSNLISNWENQHFIDQFYSFNSFYLWESLTKIFKKNLKGNTLYLMNTDIPIDKKSLLKNLNNKNLFIDDYELSSESKYNDYIHNQIQVIKQYTNYFFTLEWWSLLQTSGKKILLVILQDILDYIYCFIIPMQKYLNNKSDILKKYDYLLEKRENKINQIFKSINFIVFKQLEIQKQHTIFSIWENIHFSSFRINLLSYYVSILSFFSFYWFSLLIGGSSVFLWIMFERVRTLTHLSWNTELDLLVLSDLSNHANMNLASQSINKKNQLREQYNLSLQKWSVWLRLFFSNQIGNKIQTIWLYNTNTSDVYGDRRDLSFEVTVGNKSLLGLTLSNLDEKMSCNNGYESLKQEGLDYLKQLTNNHYKWYKSVNKNLLHSQRFISFAFYKIHSTSLDLWYQHKSELIKQKYLPISLQLSDLYSRAILLIGPKDTGKSYLVKSLAADANLPLVYFAIDKLVDVLEFEDGTLEGDSSLYFLRENFLKFKIISNFIKNIDSCIVWMPSIEYVHKYNHNISKTKEFCTLLILRFLLKDMTTLLNIKPNIMFVGSCQDTGYLDPGFISIQRFNRFINVRMPSNFRRPQIFANFLKNNLLIKSEHAWFSEFSNSTMGFTLRDLTALSNEALLISLDKQKKYLKLEDIRLVLYRGLRANENSPRTSIVQNNEILQYKIGRAILQTTLVRPNPMIPLRSRYDLWKPRFYYLSKAYLQPDSLESTVTQLNILPHILSCLAGLAAQDAWLFFKKNTLREEIFDVNTELSHDMDLAVNLFQSIFKEFAYLDISTYHYNNLFHPEFHQINNLVTIDQGNDVTTKTSNIYCNDINLKNSEKSVSSEEFLENVLFDISCSSKEERLRLSRNMLFDVFKRVDEPLSLFSSLRFFGNLPYMNISFETQKSYAGIYHISWDVMQSQIPKDLDYVFYGMLYKQRITMLGLPMLFDNLIEYEPPENNLLSFGGRPILNPAATFLRNLVFRQRNLFANEELLSILYLMYQSQKNLPSMPKKNRRKELWTPDLYLEKLAMDNKLQQSSKKRTFMKINQTFHMFKHLAHANAVFKRPQAEVPKNSEMSFIKRFIASNRFSRFSFIEDIFNQNNILKDNNVKCQELLTYAVILESYYFLFKFFIKNQFLLKNITNNLIEEGILFEEDLQKIIYESLKNCNL
jgi:AAA+ superfamily predicted ATPase